MVGSGRTGLYTANGRLAHFYKRECPMEDSNCINIQTIRYRVNQLRREDQEKKYLSVLSFDDPVRYWFNDGSVDVSKSTKEIIKNIKNQGKKLK